MRGSANQIVAFLFGLAAKTSFLGPSPQEGIDVLAALERAVGDTQDVIGQKMRRRRDQARAIAAGFTVRHREEQRPILLQVAHPKDQRVDHIRAMFQNVMRHEKVKVTFLEGLEVLANHDLLRTKILFQLFFRSLIDVKYAGPGSHFRRSHTGAQFNAAAATIFQRYIIASVHAPSPLSIFALPGPRMRPCVTAIPLRWARFSVPSMRRGKRNSLFVPQPPYVVAKGDNFAPLVGSRLVDIVTPERRGLGDVEPEIEDRGAVGDPARRDQVDPAGG